VENTAEFRSEPNQGGGRKQPMLICVQEAGRSRWRRV